MAKHPVVAAPAPPAAPLRKLAVARPASASASAAPVKKRAAGGENSAPSNKGAAAAAGAKAGGGKSLEELLAMHNKQFKPKVTYEPAKHGVKDIRKWEVEHGRTWYDLTPEERQEANDWIAAKKWTEAA